MTLCETGFAMPAIQSAECFRILMDCMARPGLIGQLSGRHAPAPVSPAASAAMLTLCDSSTGIYLAPSHDSAALRDWIAFHCGSPLVSAEQADFAIGRWDELGPVERYRHGEAEYPDRSVTLLVACDTLEPRGARLTGPGIQTAHHLNLPEIAAFQTNRARFPFGFDCFFTAGVQIAALPRTTKVEAS